MSAPITMDELKTLRAALAVLEDAKNEAFNFRKDSLERAIAYDIAHQKWWTAACHYDRRVNEFIESGQVEGVRV